MELSRTGRTEGSGGRVAGSLTDHDGRRRTTTTGGLKGHPGRADHTKVKHAGSETSASGSLVRLVTAALDKVRGRNGRRYERRRDPRAPADIVGTLDGVVVWVADLTVAGAGLLGPHPFELGRKVDLTVQLPMMDGQVRTTRLRFKVTACRPDLESGDGWRVGGTIVPQCDLDRIALVEYCHLAAAWSRLEGITRVQGRSRQVQMPQPALAAG